MQQLELFDQTLLSMTQKSENLLSGLRSSCRIDVSDIGDAMNKLRVSTYIFFVIFELFHFTNFSNFSKGAQSPPAGV